MNPFDLRTALLAKHAQHVVVIHFPIALFMVSFAFDLLALWRRDRTMAAAVATVPAVITGLLAWQWQYGGKRLRGESAATSAPGSGFELDDLDQELVQVIDALQHESPLSPIRDQPVSGIRWPDTANGAASSIEPKGAGDATDEILDLLREAGVIP